MLEALPDRCPIPMRFARQKSLQLSGSNHTSPQPVRVICTFSKAGCRSTCDRSPWPGTSSTGGGRINAFGLWEQMNTCSCLNLNRVCIVYWQAREISRVLSQCDPVANGVDTSLLEHVSPIEWDNVVLYGQYIRLYVSERHYPTSL